MTEIIKNIDYQNKQLLVTLDFWGTKVLLKIVLSDQILATIVAENSKATKSTPRDTQYANEHRT